MSRGAPQHLQRIHQHVKTEQKTTRTRNSRKWRKSRNSQNKGKQTKMHKTRISQRSRQKKRKSEKQNSRTKQFKQKPGEDSHNKVDFQKWAMIARGGNQQAKQNNSWLCEMGGIWCHAMLCMHVVDSRRCPVHGEHENSGTESSASDNKRWNTRTEGRNLGKSSVAAVFHGWFAMQGGLASGHPAARAHVAPPPSALSPVRSF